MSDETLDIKKTIAELGTAFAEFKTHNNERIEKLGKGHKDAELEAKVDKINTRISELDAHKAKLDLIETALKRNTTRVLDAKGNEMPEDWIETKGLYNRFLRKGIDSDNRESKQFTYDPSKKSLSVQSDADGGYTVHADVNGRTVGKIYESSPVRQLANVITISTDALEGIHDNDEASSGWVNETGTRAETETPQIGSWRIPVHEMFANPRATQKLLDDSAVNIEQWLADKVSKKFGRDEATAFVSGDGANKPRGFLSYPHATTEAPDTVEQVNVGAGVFTSDGIVNAYYKLKGEHRARAVWGFQRLGIAAIRKIKGTQNDHYMWQPGLAAGQPSTLMGNPIVEMADLQDMASNSLSGVLADWQEFYQIVDRIGLRVLRDPYSAKPFVQFYTTRRVGGAMLNSQAGKILKLAAV
jgi:HK97 family phage major capsid protein